jgi:hypothetical protein
MRLYQKIITRGLVVAGLAGFLGCGKKNPNETQNLEQSLNAYVITEPKDFRSYFSSSMGVGVTTGDVDGDGLNDFIVGTPFAVKYFRNTGEGRFSEQQTVCEPKNFESYFSSSMGVGVSLSDIDGDNDLDLIVATPFQVRAYQNNQGHFSEVQR